MFYGLRPVREGFGMKLMKRMGWREGEPLGKAKEGHIEPIPVDVKTDRQGIVVVYTNNCIIGSKRYEFGSFYNHSDYQALSQLLIVII